MTTRTAADLRIGDTVGKATVTAIEDIEAICSPLAGAPKVPARLITWAGGMTTTLAYDVKIAS